MDFSANKQDTYEKRIASLPDQPNMQPDELKAYFDSSPEQLRQAHNGLCDALTEATSSTSAASGLGFQRTAGVPADNVQDAIEDVQAQLTDAVLGNIPSGSVTEDKLAQDVRDRFAAIESAAAAETSARASADTAETAARASADSNLQTQINAKCEIIYGSYTGDGTAERTISLGRTPKALILCKNEGIMFDSTSTIYGGVALPNYPVYSNGAKHDAAAIVNGGFKVYTYSVNNRMLVCTNGNTAVYHYIAMV